MWRTSATRQVLRALSLPRFQITVLNWLLKGICKTVNNTCCTSTRLDPFALLSFSQGSLAKRRPNMCFYLLHPRFSLFTRNYDVRRFHSAQLQLRLAALQADAHWAHVRQNKTGGPKVGKPWAQKQKLKVDSGVGLRLVCFCWVS